MSEGYSESHELASLQSNLSDLKPENQRQRRFVDAVASGNCEDIRETIQKKEEWDLGLVNQVNVHGTPCIMLAPDRETVELLLQSKANPNASDFHGATPLHKACNRNSSEIAGSLTVSIYSASVFNGLLSHFDIEVTYGKKCIR